ncbi:MAG: anti-sigma factor antagonist [Acidobacteria bacterium]|nr:anti-sigma factor antagonist [Acidobacteriota bacterium]
MSEADAGRRRRRVPRLTSGSLRLELESKVEYIDFVHAMTEKLARMAGLNRDRSFQTGLAVREGLINAIRHGNRGDPGKKVIVAFLLRPGTFCIRIRDQGDGFDFGRPPNPLDPENLYLANGRGIFLMRHFAEEVRFRRPEDGGTEVELIQRMGRSRSTGGARRAPVATELSEGGEGMKASVRKIGDVYVLDLAGKITIGAGDLILREAVNALLEEGHRNIVLNLERVSYMDSAGIGELVACRKRAKDHRGGVKLLNPSGKVSDLLHLTKLEEIFEIFNSEERALASFS